MIGVHPRENTQLWGHEVAERLFLDALQAGRLHHAWLISGPRGVGKATLAYRMARYLLANPDGPVEQGGLFGPQPAHEEGLGLPADHPVLAKVAAGGHGNLMTVERSVDDKRKVLRSEIVVADIRRLAGHFSNTAAEPGWRIAIIDSADEMNVNAANALLKLLEEPPEKSILLLVCHAPGRLLPTIRSRCTALTLKPLDDISCRQVLDGLDEALSPDDQDRLMYLARGAPGRAVQLAGMDVLEPFGRLEEMLVTLPELDWVAAHALAGELAPKAQEDRLRMLLDCWLDWTASLVRTAAGVADGVSDRHAALAAKASPSAWLDLLDLARPVVDTCFRLALDRKQLVLSLMDAYQAVASGRAPALDGWAD